MAAISIPCSNCAEILLLSIDNGIINGTRVSNGLRGSKHIPKSVLPSDISEDPESDLIMWDCPLCGYADSFDPDC